MKPRKKTRSRKVRTGKSKNGSPVSKRKPHRKVITPHRRKMQSARMTRVKDSLHSVFLDAVFPAERMVSGHREQASLSDQSIQKENGSAPASFGRSESYDEQVLPDSYGKTKLVCMVRDPFWAFSYWDLSALSWSGIRNLYERCDGKVKSVLRVYDITRIDWNGFDANAVYDIEVFLEQKNWYVHLNKPDREWIADLGLIDPDGRFIIIARSNRFQTPRDRPSDSVDKAWKSKFFNEFYQLAGGGRYGSSGMSARLKRMKNLWERDFFSSSANRLFSKDRASSSDGDGNR